MATDDDDDDDDDDEDDDDGDYSYYLLSQVALDRLEGTLVIRVKTVGILSLQISVGYS